MLENFVQVELTLLHQTKVAKNLFSKFQILELGALLNVPEPTIYAIVNTENEMQAAAMDMLRSRRETVATDVEAYMLLRQALIESDLHSIVMKVFGR